MKFSCEREALLKNLHIAQKATDSKSNISVLKNILMNLGDDVLEIVGFDHRMGIKTEVKCVIEEKGRVAAPCNLLIDILNVMRGETAYFTLEDMVLRVECDKSKYNVHCMNADDFPPLPEIGDEKSFEIDRAILETGLKQTVLATNPDDARPFMCGVYIDSDRETMNFAGTDGHRLSHRKFDVTSAKPPIFNIVVPARTLNELLKIMADLAPSKVKVSVGEKSVSFSFDSTYITSRLIDVVYPKYEKVIPAASEGTCRVGRLKLIGAVKGAAIMSAGKENKGMVEVVISDDNIKITSSTQDVGAAVEEIEAVKKGKDIRFAFSAKYMVDFLTAVTDDEIVIEFEEELKPGLFKTDSPDYKYVLMPIKA